MGNCSSKAPEASVPATKPSGGTPPPPPQSDAAKPEPSARQMATPSVREKLIGLHAKAQKNKHGEEKTSNTHQGEDTRLQVIFAAPIEIDPNFEPPVHEKTHEQAEFINLALASNFIFSNLEEEERNTLINAMDEYSVVAGDDIIKQGDIGDYFYVIENGAVKFTVDGAEVGKTGTGDAFGELALLYNCPRAATCTALDACDLWRVDQETFRKILASQSLKHDEETKELLRKVPFLSKLDDNILNKIATASTTVKYAKDEVIVRKGDEGNVFYIVKEGKVKVSDIGLGGSKYVDMFLTVGGFFGERALITGEVRAANVTAAESCRTLCLSREVFLKLLGPLQDLIDNSMLKQALHGVPAFAKANLQAEQWDDLVSYLVDTEFEPNHMIAREGRPTRQAIYLIRSGKVAIHEKDGEDDVTILAEGDYFGDESFNIEDMFISKSTITAVEQTKCKMLTLQDIRRVVGRGVVSSKKEDAVDKRDKSILFEDIQRRTILGAGTFGQVWLVNKKGTKDVYALKIQNKRELIQHHQVDGVKREKDIMTKLDHPFIIKLFNTYQDDKNIFMLMQIAQGGELFSIMHTDQSDILPEPNAKFYAACILEGLAYMHKRFILYRDLKPENVMIDAMGYTVIIDLGFAKVVTDKTYTLCGTPLYLAPEVILSRGHDKGADYWSYGCLVFEMILGSTPFYSDGIDQMTLFKRIVRGKYAFPSYGAISPEAKDLVKRLLVPRNTDRLGSFAGGSKDIRSHPWLKAVDWDNLVRKQVTAPWTPTISDPLDTKNFDNWDHLEDMAQRKDPPLSARQQAQFEGF
mmetsp:Transcript_42789/g.64393  ORF Transcript_42789/g.64393 Transcript_42789/m.64393 type:complete len:807 (+) Transcript_42789:41-2461(+)